MQKSQIAYALEEIAEDLRFHMAISPLDDIVENAIHEIDIILAILNEEL